ncbi:MAG: hypothetical protein KJ571_12955 [Bacteroidetes bacterium]|nr:hypothetical protein [Bacteroidota bacterium]
MTEEQSFNDELLLEAEAKENKLTLAHYDLIIGEISNLKSKKSYKGINFQNLA